jgi:hypothetical protein
LIRTGPTGFAGIRPSSWLWRMIPESTISVFWVIAAPTPSSRRSRWSATTSVG